MEGRALKSLRVALLAPILASFFAPTAAAADPADEDLASPRFEIGVVGGGPFPTDLFTVSDEEQFTGLRVSLPKPDCSERPSDCEDIDVLNTLDGFNLNPRLAIPFDADIDPTSVTSETVFLLALDGNERVGINQVVWDRLSQTLYAESDLTLREAARYVLIVTRGVRDVLGERIEASGAFQAFRHGLKLGQRDDDAAVTAYRDALLAGLDRAVAAGLSVNDVAVASVFTTQSITPTLVRMRDYLRSIPAPRADFLLGPGGSRTVFARSSIQGLRFNQQTGVTPPSFTAAAIGLAPLDFVPGAVGSIAYGRIATTSFLQDDLMFSPVGTGTGLPEVAGTEQLYLNLYIPSGTKPAGGWPVAVIGPGANQNKEAFSVLLASKLAQAGIVSIGLNPVGRGFGPLSTNTVMLVGGTSVTFPAGGRGRDTNGDNVIGSSEGADAPSPFGLVGSRDTTRQTILDHVQLARAIEAGIDFDGDDSRDLDPDRTGFIGWSFGSNYGVPAVALEPAFKTAVFSAVGGPLVDNRRLGANRNLVEAQLAARVPSLDNLDGSVSPFFNDNFPLRDQPPVINSVAGAMAIQDYIDNNEWALQSADIVPFASRLRSEPLAGSAARAVLINIAKGDQTVPNPAASKVIRAGGLSDVTMFYRHDTAFSERPTLPKNPHQFMTLINNAAFAPISAEVEHQAAQFLATGGAVITEPSPARYFEMPIPLPLPETLNFIP
jgi:hypothetical protein